MLNFGDYMLNKTRYDQCLRASFMDHGGCFVSCSRSVTRSLYVHGKEGRVEMGSGYTAEVRKQREEPADFQRPLPLSEESRISAPGKARGL